MSRFQPSDLATLPDFRRNQPCPKCGNKTVTVRYRQATNSSGIRKEWLSRQCARCLYTWAESCLPGGYESDADDPFADEYEDD